LRGARRSPFAFANVTQQTYGGRLAGCEHYHRRYHYLVGIAPAFLSSGFGTGTPKPSFCARTDALANKRAAEKKSRAACQ
jgi:hypothetical protein